MNSGDPRAASAPSSSSPRASSAPSSSSPRASSGSTNVNASSGLLLRSSHVNANATTRAVPKLALRRLVTMLARTTLRAALRNPYPYRRSLPQPLPWPSSHFASDAAPAPPAPRVSPHSDSSHAETAAVSVPSQGVSVPQVVVRRRSLAAMGSRIRSLFRPLLRSESTLSGNRPAPSTEIPAIPVSESNEMSKYRMAEQALLSYLPSDLNWRLHQVQIPRKFWHNTPDSPLAAPPTTSASRRCNNVTSSASRWRASKSSKLPEYYDINTLTVTGKKGQPTAADKPHLVLVHGWGGALGMWLRNVEQLSEHYTVHAIDLLGWGGSSRPPFSSVLSSSSSSSLSSPALAAQAYFVDSLESWRAANHIPKMHLVGHSMGGFIAASYALRFPTRLTDLTLLSPIGLQGFAAPPTATLRARLQAALVHQAWQVTPQRILVQVLGTERARGMVMRARTRIARMFGSSGGGPGARDIPPAVIVEYLLAGIHRAPGVAGEAAFAQLGSPAKGWAVPLDQALRGAMTDGSMRGMSVAIAYGVGDWIDPRYALWELQPHVLAQGGTSQLEVYLVDGAGHHTYVENVRAFNDIVMRNSKGRVRAEARHEPDLVAAMVQARAGGGFMSIA